MRTALFAGSFRPFTIGHADIVSRALAVFDRVVVCVGVNFGKEADPDTLESVRAIEAVYAAEPRVSVIARQGLTVDIARETGACALLRGVRSAKDYEYERDMADANRALGGIDTVILVARPELSFISSSLVRELKAFGRSVEQFLPTPANHSQL